MSHTNERFFHRSFLRYVRLILLPLLVFSVLGQLITVRSITRDAAHVAQTQLRQLEAGMDNIIGEMDAFVLAFDQPSVFRTAADILREPDLSYERSITRDILQDWTKSLVNARIYVDSIYIYIENNNDRVLHSSEGITRLDQMLDKEWLDIFHARRANSNQWTLRRPYHRYNFESNLSETKETVSLFRVIRSGRGVIVLNLSPQFMQQQLAHMTTYDGQQVYILNEYGDLLLYSGAAGAVPPQSIQEIISQHPGETGFSHKNSAFTVLEDQRYGWQYISVVPRAVLYRTPVRLLIISALLLIACMVLCVLLAWQHTARNRRRLSGIYALLDAAGSNEPLPPLPQRRADEYSYIEQNIIAAFIRQNALEKQLQNKSYQLKSLELLALQAQINPHFLVNTLNTIFWRSMGLTNGPNPVSEMIEDLSGMLDCLVGDPNEIISLAEEARYLTYYIHIQQHRFPDRFTFEVDIPDECASLRILRLVLQPLAENCVTHALCPDRVIHIRLTARILGDEAEIRISDDGEGMSLEKAEALRQQWQDSPSYTHIGLVNTVKRLMLFYDRNDLVTLETAPGSGTTIAIRLPRSQMLPDTSIL